MDKIKNSIRQRPVNAVLIVITAAVYLLNNLILKDMDGCFLQDFFEGYLNDLMCPLFILPYSNILLMTVDRELKKLSHILLMCLGGSILWEFIAPLYKPGAVADVLDIFCYLMGGLIYWAALKSCHSTSKEKIDGSIDNK